MPKDPNDMTTAEKLDVLAMALESQQAILVTIALLELERAGKGPAIDSKEKELLLKALTGFASVVIHTVVDMGITPPEKN